MTLLKKELKEKTLLGAAFTSDIWTTRNQDAFIDVTIHYVISSFELKNKLLDSKHFPERQTEYEILKKRSCGLSRNRLGRN